VPPDCQAFVNHFRPIAAQLLDVRVFAVGESYLPLLRPSRDAARVDAVAAFLERPAPPAPKTAPTLLDSMLEIVREQTVDSRGMLAALARADIESYRRLSIRYRSSRERLLSLDDSLDASCATHVVRARVSFSKARAVFLPHQPAFQKCYAAAPAQNRRLGVKLDVKVIVDERGTVQGAEVDSVAQSVPDAGTEAFFEQLGYRDAAQSSAPAITDRNVVTCVLGEVKTVHFAPVPGGATARFPILFNGQEPVQSADE
jgi:hypothetical protein